MDEPEINVGILVAHSPEAPVAALVDLAREAARMAERELAAASGAAWRFHLEEPTRLADDEPRRPSDFLDEASLRMAEGPFDLVVVCTDVGLVSRHKRLQPGLASPVGRVVVVSTRKLLMTPRGRPPRALDQPIVRANAAALLLHLIGHTIGLPHTDDADDAMRPFAFDEGRTEAPAFGEASRRRLRSRVDRMPEREHRGSGPAGALLFHLASAARHPGQVLRPLLRNRALLLPLSLPGLATAAVAPTFILVFTAEIWDVGLNLGSGETWLSAAVTILAATWYLISVQNLLYPRKERRVIPEHMAVVNVSIVLTMLLAIIGLFALVGLLMLLIETYIFPSGLIRTWPTLEDPVVDLADKVRLAAFISTVGVITGALAGGLESRTLIRHLALFLDEP